MINMYIYNYIYIYTLYTLYLYTHKYVYISHSVLKYCMISLWLVCFFWSYSSIPPWDSESPADVLGFPDSNHLTGNRLSWGILWSWLDGFYQQFLGCKIWFQTSLPHWWWWSIFVYPTHTWPNVIIHESISGIRIWSFPIQYCNSHKPRRMLSRSQNNLNNWN